MLSDHLIIGLSDDAKAVEFQPVHPLLDDWHRSLTLAELEHPGVDTAIRMLGFFALMALRAMHQEALAAYPGLLADPAGLPETPLLDLLAQPRRV